MRNRVSLYEVEAEYPYAERQEGEHWTAHLCIRCALTDIRYVIQWLADTGNDCPCDACGWDEEIDGKAEREERFRLLERRIYGSDTIDGEISLP